MITNLEKVKLIIWDLDDTLWKGTLSEGNIEIPRQNIKLLKTLNAHGVINSICSKNSFGETEAKLMELGINDFFVFKSINWEPKGKRISNLISTMGLRDENVLFIDDNIQNLKEVLFYSPNIMVSEPDVISSIISHFSNRDATDPDCQRLKQYRILEKKQSIRTEYSNNEDFLYSSNIKVEILTDCINHLHRLHELSLRANQLNFTKHRPSLSELESDFLSEDNYCGYIRVRDKFGDYGIVGFYVVESDELKHLVFSCRTIGQGIEQFVYSYLKFPKLTIVEPVATKLDISTIPGWISEGTLTDDSEGIIDEAADRQILFKSPCDLNAVLRYLDSGQLIDDEFSYVDENSGMFVEAHNHSTNIINSLFLDENDKKTLEEECAFFPNGFFESKLIKGKYKLVFLSSLIDANLGLYVNKNNGIEIAFGEYNYPLTDESNWQGYISGEIFNSDVKFDKGFLRFFRNNYEFLGRIPVSKYISNIDRLKKHLGDNCHLFVICGVEMAYDMNKNASYDNRHLIHKEINDALSDYVVNGGDIKLIRFDDVVNSQECFSGNINHYTSRVYFNMSKVIGGLIEDNLDNTVLSNVKMSEYIMIRMVEKIRNVFLYFIGNKESNFYKLSRKLHKKLTARYL